MSRMASPNPIRTRSERVASLQLEPSELRRYLSQLFTGRSLLLIVCCGLSLMALVVIFQGWRPPFTYRQGQVPTRDVVARVAFDVVDSQQTKLLRDQRRRETLCYYENRSQPILQLRSAIQNQFFSLLGDKTFDQLSASQLSSLSQLLDGAGTDGSTISPESALVHVQNLLNDSDGDQLAKFSQALQAILNPISETGVLKSLGHDSDQGSQRSIRVFPPGSPNDEVFVDVNTVRRAEIVANLPSRVSEIFQREFATPDAQVVARMVSNYIVKDLPETLSYRSDLSERARATAEAEVQDALVSYFPTVSRLAIAGQPISRVTHIPLLRAEYEAWLDQVGPGFTLARLASFIGLLFFIFLLGALYLANSPEARLLKDPIQLYRLLGLVVTTCLACKLISPDPARAELVPLLVSAIVLTISFGRQIALLISTSVSLIVTVALGLSLVELITFCSGCFAVTLFVGRIRTRSKLIYVGLTAAVVVTTSHLWMDVVSGRLAIFNNGNDLDFSNTGSPGNAVIITLISEALRLGGFALLSAALVAGLLPFFEKLFGIMTDLSLLELGDASHPLLRQLAQRAPGTYNHSINVAAIAEAAADSIGAHGLLTRVGAYFHDIGKMFKPNYFIENQDASGNCHDTLQPAMSTLVIIAHVKDGADLARQHHLPNRIVDFIEQHHGTTLVEYFYHEATKRSLEDPNREDVSETSFRYPGPKPQTLEAAVLMLADSVESASRTLVEPTASRLQNLVDKIAMKKLLDGQFDECGMTLQQLDRVKSSLVKSLTSIYHGRIKYTGQATA
jgi:putative nucleotidyltransferase with HDIG domain